MARVLILGGGCRGRRLAAELVQEDNAVRIVTRTEEGRAAIEACGAECLIGDPDRLASLRGALDGVTIACWLLATARGPAQQIRALHGSRLEAFIGQAIDTTMRGFVYEAPGVDTGGGADTAVGNGGDIVRALTSRNAIPVELVRADPDDLDGWLIDARRAVQALLGTGRS